MSLSVRFLGTSAARPTVERDVSSLAIIREGETLLFDCGEGTQRQMMRYGISFALSDIFFTHFHGDHLIGIVGLFRTLALQGREEPFRLWGPRGGARVLRAASHFGVDRIGFPVEITELEPGNSVSREGYAITAIAADHRGAAALSYVLAEEERRGRFNPDLARSLGIPEGPLWGHIHHGEPVTLEDGRVIVPEMLVGPTRSGRVLALSGDTRPNGQFRRRGPWCGSAGPRGHVRRRGSAAGDGHRTLHRARGRGPRRARRRQAPGAHAFFRPLFARYRGLGAGSPRTVPRRSRGA